MNKSIKTALALALTAVFTVGCTAPAAHDPVRIYSAGELSQVATGVSSASVKNAANEFAFKLSASLLDDDQNFLCSPISVWLPLAALTNAATDESRDELLGALGLARHGSDEINKGVLSMLQNLTRPLTSEEDKFSTLKIANAVFVDKNYMLNDGFAQLFAQYFKGTTMSVDFYSSEAVEAVNKWCSENTEGLIDKIIEEFGEDTVAAIANAVYFTDQWRAKFNENLTSKGVFNSEAGEETAYFMEKKLSLQRYYEDERVQALPLAFTGGGSMYIIKPHDRDASGLLSAMTNDYFEQIKNDSVLADGTLKLPKFTLDSGVVDLKCALEVLGVPLFDEMRAPLTGGLLDTTDSVWLSGAVQKAVIEVDEQGTTAAAVTVMLIDAASAPLPPDVNFELICDSPFVFVLCGSGGEVLFTGVLNHVE